MFTFLNPVDFKFINSNQENFALSLYVYKFKKGNLNFNIVNSSLKICTVHFFALPL
jgi:hypothetical protein